MKVIVMGGGRVGSQVSQLLVKLGHEVIVIDHDTNAFARLGPDFKGRIVRGVEHGSSRQREPRKGGAELSETARRGRIAERPDRTPSCRSDQLIASAPEMGGALVRQLAAPQAHVRQGGESSALCLHARDRLSYYMNTFSSCRNIGACNDNTPGKHP